MHFIELMSIFIGKQKWPPCLSFLNRITYSFNLHIKSIGLDTGHIHIVHKNVLVPDQEETSCLTQSSNK